MLATRSLEDYVARINAIRQQQPDADIRVRVTPSEQAELVQKLGPHWPTPSAEYKKGVFLTDYLGASEWVYDTGITDTVFEVI